MTRESNYRIHEELKATKQRPWQPPSAPRRGLKVRTVLIVAAWLLALAGAYSFWAEFLAVIRRIG